LKSQQINYVLKTTFVSKSLEIVSCSTDKFYVKVLRGTLFSEMQFASSLGIHEMVRSYQKVNQINHDRKKKILHILQMQHLHLPLVHIVAGSLNHGRFPVCTAITPPVTVTHRIRKKGHQFFPDHKNKNVLNTWVFIGDKYELWRGKNLCWPCASRRGKER